VHNDQHDYHDHNDNHHYHNHTRGKIGHFWNYLQDRLGLPKSFRET